MNDRSVVLVRNFKSRPATISGWVHAAEIAFPFFHSFNGILVPFHSGVTDKFRIIGIITLPCFSAMETDSYDLAILGKQKPIGEVHAKLLE